MLEGAVVGKQPTLSPRSTAKREPLPPTVIGDGTIVSTGAIVFAGSQIGARVILGDQSCVRERVAIGDDVVLGRGSYVENDTTIGAMTKIQADAYITAYSTLEEHVFIAPCVVTTNDNWMGRTEKRLSEMRGPTIRRGARIGGGAILCPGVEIGEEAFVGAGAVVTKDVPPRARDGREPGPPSSATSPTRSCSRTSSGLGFDDRRACTCRRRASRASPGRSTCPSWVPDRRATRRGPARADWRATSDTAPGRRRASCRAARESGSCRCPPARARWRRRAGRAEAGSRRRRSGRPRSRVSPRSASCGPTGGAASAPASSFGS